MRSVGVMGDSRTYYYTVGLRAVITSDFMTAEWARIPHFYNAFYVYQYATGYTAAIALSRNEVHGINRVVYDITTKPPATVEWL